MKVIKRKEIYYADLNPARGSEQDGIRPVIILQNDVGNLYSSTTIIAPITSRLTKKNLPTHVKIKFEGLPKDSIVLLEQMRVIDKCRLYEYLLTIDNETMEEIDKKIVIELGVKYLEDLVG